MTQSLAIGLTSKAEARCWNYVTLWSNSWFRLFSLYHEKVYKHKKFELNWVAKQTLWVWLDETPDCILLMFSVIEHQLCIFELYGVIQMLLLLLFFVQWCKIPKG